MKKLRSLLVILLLMVAIVPFSVRADELPETGKEPVRVYLFHSPSCGYCRAAITWFESIEEEYGDYFDLIKYDVSIEENSSLWEEAATMMGDTANGVPYMVVGNYSYPNGFQSDTLVSSDSKETMGDQMIDRILEIYESDNRYDVIEEINNKPNYNNVVGGVALVIIVLLGVMAVITRRNNK